jgi:hypothetical protein
MKFTLLRGPIVVQLTLDCFLVGIQISFVKYRFHWDERSSTYVTCHIRFMRLCDKKLYVFYVCDPNQYKTM